MDKVKSVMGYHPDWTVKANREAERDRWSNNSTFIVAAVGCAIGLGNLWRFPYLLYKHGGAVFFIPYLLCLFGLGIPMILLEFTQAVVEFVGDIADPVHQGLRQPCQQVRHRKRAVTVVDAFTHVTD